MAVSGYWRNWEISTAWLMREVVYTMIAGNAYIKKEDKPTKEQIMKLSIDGEKTVKKAKKAPITPEEIKEMKERLMKQINK